MTDPRPLPPSKHYPQRYEFECSSCGETDRNTFMEPTGTQMLERRLCFGCNHWRNFAEKEGPRRNELTIIDGLIYTPGNRTSGEMRGMAGRRFDIEYVEPSAYAGQKITTFDLWSGGPLPEKLRDQFPDTARFLGGARSAKVGEITCFNPSDHRSEPYPLPRTLKANSAPVRCDDPRAATSNPEM